MEKLVYLLWSGGDDGFAGRMRRDAAPRLLALGAERLALCLVDEPARACASARLTRMEEPIAGMASFWLACADDRAPFEAALRETAARIAGYAVLESVPLAPPDAPAPPGERTPGIDMVALLERRPGMSREAWLERWLDHHRAVALETQATFLYVRNVVVRALTPEAPPFEGIVEEGFAEDAVLDPAKWYAAEGDPERLRAHVARMVESCRTFLELDRVESHPTSLYRFGRDGVAPGPLA